MDGEQMTASGVGGEQGVKQKGKRTHGHGQQCGDFWGGGGYMGTKWLWGKYNKD